MAITPGVIDADCHIVEPFSIWQTHLDPKFSRHAPRLVPRRTRESTSARVARLGDRGLLPLPSEGRFAGRAIMRDLSEQALLSITAAAYARRDELERLDRPETYLAMLDREGIAACALYPTYVSSIVTMADVEAPLVEAVVDAYNRWLRDFCSVAPARLLGVGVACRHRPESLPDQVARFADWGFRAVMIRPNPFDGRSIGDPAHEGLWSACTRYDMAVAVHEGAHSWGPAVGADRFRTVFARHACSHPMEAMMAYLSLLESGVFVRHPALRIGFLESWAGWVPFWLARLDEEYELLSGEVVDRIPERPSTYFRRHCMVVAEVDEPGYARLVRSIGIDNVMFGSDFPHMDHRPGALSTLEQHRARLGGQLDLISSVNPARFYRVGVGADELR